VFYDVYLRTRPRRPRVLGVGVRVGVPYLHVAPLARQRSQVAVESMENTGAPRKSGPPEAVRRVPARASAMALPTDKNAFN